ncbi:MAG: peptidoglycan D,D-transpeptidase FtsI family protein, partial [Nocardioidaceae bacterium]
MTRRRQTRATVRLRVCFLVIAFVLSLFAARLFQLQGIDANAYAARAVAEGSRTVPLHAERGEIVDRDGEPLATSVDAVALTADPTKTAKDATQIATILVDTIGLDYFDTVERLRKPDTRFVYLAHKVPTWKADKAVQRLHDGGYANVFTERDTLRTYPGNDLAANVLGLVNNKGEGAAGLERSFQDELSGKDGSATYEISPDGERIPLADSTVSEPEPGIGLRTTLDRDLQWYADRRLKEAVHRTESDWGVAVTVDLKTMQVLQLSQLPTFNANKPSTISKDNINLRAIQNVYEPGSVQKVVTMAALADAGLVTPQSKIKIPSELQVDDFTIGDYWDHGTIKLTAAGVIAKSSNLGTVLASQQMSDEQMYGYLENFGFGSPTDIGLPGESGGILPPADGWSRSKHATIAFGQGISVTAMQEVAAVATIANGGVYTQPSLVSGLIGPDGEVTPAPAPDQHRVVSTKAADMVTRMMETVTGEDGSA